MVVTARNEGLQAEIRASFLHLGEADIPAASWKSHFEALRKQQDDLNRRQTVSRKEDYVLCRYPMGRYASVQAEAKMNSEPAQLMELEEQLREAVEAVS